MKILHVRNFLFASMLVNGCDLYSTTQAAEANSSTSAAPITFNEKELDDVVFEYDGYKVILRDLKAIVDSFSGGKQLPDAEMSKMFDYALFQIMYEVYTSSNMCTLKNKSLSSEKKLSFARVVANAFLSMEERDFARKFETDKGVSGKYMQQVSQNKSEVLDFVILYCDESKIDTVLLGLRDVSLDMIQALVDSNNNIVPINIPSDIPSGDQSQSQGKKVVLNSATFKYLKSFLKSPDGRDISVKAKSATVVTISAGNVSRKVILVVLNRRSPSAEEQRSMAFAIALREFRKNSINDFAKSLGAFKLNKKYSERIAALLKEIQSEKIS